MKLEKQLINLIKTASRKPEATDLTAKVLRVEGQTAWVHFDGGAEETPVEMSISCEPGDDVRVRINKGAAYIIGNNTNPPTNDRIIVKYAADLAQAAREVANRAYENLQEILSTYVTRGSSNISTLSSAMTQTDEGTNVYDSLATDSHYLHVDADGIDLKTVANGNNGVDDSADKKIVHAGTDTIQAGPVTTGTRGSTYLLVNDSGLTAKMTKTAGSGDDARDYQIMHIGAFGSRNEIGYLMPDDQLYIEIGDSTMNKSYGRGPASVMIGGGIAKGTGAMVFGEGQADGNSSVVIGQGWTTGASSVAIGGTGGSTNKASGNGAVSIGVYAYATGYLAISLGGTASGRHALSEGAETIASGEYSHAGGLYTKAGYTSQTTIGKYNSNRSDTLFEVGNGTDDNARSRSNAFDVTTDGYIRTGVGSPTKVAFGSVNNYYGWYDSNGSFSPWAFLVNGKVPESLLPSYVDDVIEGYYYNGSFYEDDQYQTLITPERGKIYISLDTDKSYRWSGTVYVELTSGGVVYSAGTGIDISVTNEISVDSSVAMVADLPTKTSDLTNDSGFITSASLPTKTSDLTNDSGFITSASLPTKTSDLTNDSGFITSAALANYLPLTGGTLTGTLNTVNVAPTTDNVGVIGASNKRYSYGYVRRLYALESIEKSTDTSKRLLLPDDSGTIALTKNIPSIAFGTQINSGILLGTLTLNGTNYKIYAPKYTGGTGINIDSSTYEISVDTSIIPDELADLSDDSTHRLVTDTEKTTWNGKQGALTAGTGIALSSANTISIKYYGAHAEAASGGANNNKREGMADSGDGMFLTGSYNDPNAPYTYGNIININGGGTGQLFLGWRGDNDTGSIYYRSHRDNSSAAWGSWKRVAYVSDVPSVGDGRITIQKNGSTVDSFTTNQSSAKTINISISKSDVGLGNVENKSSATIRGELTSSNITTALGYTPLNSSNPSATGRFTVGSCGHIHIGNTPYDADNWSDFLENSELEPDSGINICQDENETSGIHMDGESIVMWSSCDQGALWYYDTDDGDIVFHIDYNGNYYNKAGNSFLTSSIFPLSRANGGTGNTLGQAAQLDVPRDSVNPNTAMTTAPVSTVRIDECNPNASGVPEANWFHYITTHSLDTRYGSQLALGMTTNKVYSRDYNGGSWGAWKRLAFADEIPSVSGYLPLAGGTMNTTAKINFVSTANQMEGIYFDAGTYGLALAIGNGLCNRGLWDPKNSNWILYKDATSTHIGSDSNGTVFLESSTVINPKRRSWGDGLRINCEPQDGFALAVFGGAPGSTTGPSSGYQEYGIGKWYDGTFIIKDVTDNQKQILTYYPNGNLILDSDSQIVNQRNVVINTVIEDATAGLRINSEPNRADGYALVTFGGPSGSGTGTNSSYPMYQIGKTRTYGGAFWLKAIIGGTESPLMYGHNAGLQFYSFDQTKQVDIQNDGIRTRTNKLYLHGKDNNYSDGSGEPSRPIILDGFESGQINSNSSQNTSIDIASTGDKLVLVFLSAAYGNSFYAVRLLRNNNGTLQTINLASNGTSIATISLNANQTNYITIKNTSSSYRLYYKILKLG